ncbi:MAG: DNA translocase FtsK 4TM domain-containing protein [Prolixibacteraceae bacterium]|nr:DNA translocase FtsK 4TM domain-containing protein [Prolixibacteraceae bacterium]
MAKDIKRKINTHKKNIFSRIRAFFCGDKFRITVGIIFLMFSFYLLISFLSFLFSGEADHSKLDISWGKLIGDSNIRVENKAGKTGAFLSEYIINRGFGIGSFLFIYIIVVTAFQLLKRPFVKYFKTICLSFIMIFWFSLFFGLLRSAFDLNGYLYLGGENGLYMSSWLSSMFGVIGVSLLLLLCLFMIIFFGTEKFILLLKNIFSRNNRKQEEMYTIKNEKHPVEEDPQISKKITENDQIETVFNPDDNNKEDSDDPLEIIPAVSSDSMEKEISGKGKSSDDLKMTVEKKKEENVSGKSSGDVVEDYDPTLDLSNYKYPTIDLLDEREVKIADVSNEELISNKNKIVETLRQYKIEITKIRATIGPTITLYEIVPAPGIRIAKIKNLEDDIALSLAALGIRIIAPIPGRGTIGIEVPNRKPELVSMRSIINSKKFRESTAELPVVLGKTISNETFIFDLTKMPHILVAGATGQGKSVGLNAIITSLLYKKHPSQLKFVMIDPKKVELSLYSKLEKYFLAKMEDDEPIITDIQKVKATLSSLNREMDARYDLLKLAQTRNIKEYNSKFIHRRLNPEKGHRYLPYIVVIIDEFADLIMTAGKEIELPIARIAQLARAVGIHMIIATQRPSADIITGIIKANFPARIAFKVASMVDSRTILDTSGANQLIGKGDMLVSIGSTMTRLQCAFVDTPEVERICDFVSQQQGYPSALILPDPEESVENVSATNLSNRDELFDEVARIVVVNQMGSTSMIQRKFSIGYNRAGRIMDQLEAMGIVGPAEGSKARQVLVQDEYSLEKMLKDIN